MSWFNVNVGKRAASQGKGAVKKTRGIVETARAKAKRS